MTRTEKKFQSFSKNHFSPRFIILCSLLAENIFLIFRSPHLLLDTPFWTRSRKAGFPFATRARKREPCPQRYVSRMTLTKNFLSQNIFQSFSGNYFSKKKYPANFFENRIQPDIRSVSSPN